MFKQLCPTCREFSYSADENHFSPCPYCGVRFSGRYGSDRRREERIKRITACFLNFGGRSLEAETIDFSREGLGIKILAESPVAVGETIELSTGDLQIKARIIWSNKLADKYLIGLERVN